MKQWVKFSISMSLTVAAATAVVGFLHFRNNQPVNQNGATQTTNSNAPAKTNSNTNTNLATPTPPVVTTPSIVIPTTLNLDVPFTSQAPFANWDKAHEDYCEEASLLMANRFLTGRKITDAADADQAMQAIAAWEVQKFGYFESTTAEETATVATEFLGLKAKVVRDFTWDQVKQELAQGHLVLLPTAGRELGNPHFTAPGPVYHMLLVKGWTADSIMTNDPGTRLGADYKYDPDVLRAAVGDFNHDDPAHGDTVMIVVWK